MTHDELRGLIPLLALDSLPVSEEAELVAHLKICTECSELLASHEHTVGALGLLAPPQEPPRMLRERILSEAERTQQFIPGGLPEQAHSRRYRRTGLRVAAVAMAAVLMIGGVGAQQLLEQKNQLQEQRQLLAEQRKALDLASAGSAIILPISSTEDYRDVQGSVVLSDETDRAAVLMAGLDDPGDNVYTLWLTPAEGEPRNLADFAPDDSGLAVINLEAEVGERDTLAVTLEPRRDNARPTGPVVGSASRSPEGGSRIA